MVTKSVNILEGSYSETHPSELDYLKPNGFKFQIHNIPNVNYFCQAANIPNITLGVATQATTMSDIPYPGEKLTYGDLTIRFLIQENLKNYMELYNWLNGLGAPKDKTAYKEWNDRQRYRFPGVNENRIGDKGNFSDATLFILDSDNNPNVKITFYDCFPINLEALDFDISSGTVDYLTGIATFKYRYYDMETI